MSETQCDNKIYGKDIPNIYENNSGKIYRKSRLRKRVTVDVKGI